MSGLEIVIIVGAGIFIAKKVRERKQKKLAAAGLLPEQHGRAQEVVSPNSCQPGRQQITRDKEEDLPLYSPPTTDLALDTKFSDSTGLPTYRETVADREAHNPNSSAMPSGSNVSPLRMTPFNTTSTSMLTEGTKEKERQQRWKVWNRRSLRKSVDVNSAQSQVSPTMVQA